MAVRVTEDLWSLELAVEIARLGLKRLDGRDLVIQLVRSDDPKGIYFAGWTPAPWMAWEKFARVDFDAQAPVFQLLQVGEVGKGQADGA